MTQSQLLTRIFRKSTPILIATVMAVGLLAGASRSQAFNLTWTNGNGAWNSTTAWTTNQATGVDPVGLTNITCSAGAVSNVTATCVGGTGGFPSTGDTAFFTNSLNPNVTVTSSANLSTLIFSNTLVTMGATPGTTLTVTGSLRIASDNSTTATVYWAGGTLGVTNGGPANVQVGTGTNSVGILIVTNGTVVYDQNTPPSSSFTAFSIGGIASAGKVVISGSGVITNRIGGQATLNMNGSPTTTSQLIITNGGKLFGQGATQSKSNSLILVSDPGSVITNSDTSPGAGTGVITIGSGNLAGPGSLLIVSNGATVWGDGTISLGRGGSFNTGMVCGAGSKLISGPTGGFVIGITGGSTNALIVYNGGYLSSGGTFEIPDGSPCPNNSFQMGGVGAMSTGVVIHVKNNSGSLFSSIIVTNAILTASEIEIEGGPSNTLSVLSSGTLIFSNQFAASTTLTNVLVVESFTAGGGNAVTINAGTLSAVSSSNVSEIVIGSSGEAGAGSMIITNGGRLLSELVQIGSSSSFNTGVVVGVGSVWSNFTAGVIYGNSNKIYVGVGSSAAGTRNYLAVQNGAVLVNNGDLAIGNGASSTFNAVVFGGPGVPATITSSGSINVGATAGSTGNSLIISNASLTCDELDVGAGTNRINNSLAFNGGTISATYVEIGGTNTIVFTAGTLSAGGMLFHSSANSGNAFVVGDGVSAAYYDMAAGGIGYHEFDSPGLVVTNGAFLRGNGTLVGTLKVLGTFVPGFANAVGSIFSSNSLTFGTSAVLDYDLGISSDSVTVNGNLALGGTLNINDAGGFGPGSYTLFTYAGTLSSGTLTVGTTPNGSLTYVINTNTTGLVILQVTGGAGDPFTTWQSHYFGGNTGTASGNADPFGKGMSNTNQFLAGFNPLNPAAYLHITSIAKTNANTDIRVDYLGASGDSTYAGGPASRTNVLEFTTGVGGSYNSNNFVSTGQTNILNGGAGLGTLTNMVDPGGATAGATRYYRVRVLVP